MAPFFWPAIDGGGPARSLTNLVAEIDSEHEVIVLAADRDHQSGEPFEGLSGHTLLRFGAKIYYVNWKSPRQVLSALNQIRGEQFDIVLINGLWHKSMSFLPAVLIGLGVINSRSVVLMPRNELEEGALSLKSGKKKIAMPLVRRVYGRSVTMGAATSVSEQANFERWLPGRRCILTTNTPDPISPGFLPAVNGRMRLLFISRIHPMKGLRELLDALRLTQQTFALTIAGPIGDSNYWRECQSIIHELAARVEIKYVGSVARDEIERYFWSADLLVLLSLSENFGHSIAEALQAGCPVMTCGNTPWTEMLRDGAGVVVEDRADAREVARLLDSAWASHGLDSSRRRQLARSAYEEWMSDKPANVIEQVVEIRQESNS